MTPRHKFGLKYLGALFVALLLMYGITLSVGLLLVMPLIRWASKGEIQFSVTGPDLFRLACLVFSMTIVTTIVMWLEGKWKERW